MKAKQQTLSEIHFLNGISEGQLIFVGKKTYIFKTVAIAKVDAYTNEHYFIVLDMKGNLQVLQRNTLATVL